MMRSALNALDAHSETTAMIGDRMDTDVIAGLEAGLHTVLVLTGVTGREEAERFPYRAVADRRSRSPSSSTSSEIARRPDDGRRYRREVELRHLRYFVAVGEELHFRRAAERLHVSQPPLSQQIRALEAELGVTLFERNRRRVELTEPGRALLGEARGVLAAVDRAVELTQRVARGEAGALAVGFVGSAMYGALPDVLREFRAQRPGVELRLRELPTGAALDALLEGRIDVGVVRPAQVGPGHRPRHVRARRWSSRCRRRHPLARRRRLALADLAGEAFVLLARREAPGVRAALDGLGSRRARCRR